MWLNQNLAFTSGIVLLFYYCAYFAKNQDNILKALSICKIVFKFTKIISKTKIKLKFVSKNFFVRNNFT